MIVKQIADILNNQYKVEAEGDSSSIVLANDLSNIVDFGAAITANTTFSDLFANTCGNLIDKVARVMFNTGDFVSTAPSIMKTADTWGSMVEMIRVDVGDFINNKSWEVIGSNPTDTNTFNDMFGAELPTTKAKYFNKLETYDNKISLTDKQFASAFRSPADMAAYFNAIELRLAQKLAFAEDRLKYMAFDSAVLEVAKSRTNTSVIQCASGTTAIVKQLKKIIRDFTVYNAKYTGDGFVTSTPKSHIRLAISGDLYDDIVTSYANVFNPDFLKIPIENIDVLPYFQYDSAPTVMSGITPSTKATDSTGSYYTSIDGIQFVVYDDRLVGCYTDNSRVKTVPVANKEMTNYFHKKDFQYIVNTDFPCIVATTNGATDVSDELIDE